MIGEAVAVEDLSPRTSATGESPMNSRPMRNACGEAVGLRLHGVGERQAELRAVAEQRAGSRGRSCGVVMTRISRMPASISVDSG